jgi:hypothetical protein
MGDPEAQNHLNCKMSFKAPVYLPSGSGLFEVR